MADFEGRVIGRSGEVSDIIGEFNKRPEDYGRYFPTILIGLGGTGAKILQRVRRLTIERFGTLDDLKGVRYLSIDTDMMSESEDPQGRDAARKNPLAEQIRFRPEERIRLSAPLQQYLGNQNLLENPHIAAWMDPVVSGIKLNLDEGAGQIRPLARLAFTHNVDDGERIRDRLTKAFTDVRSMAVGSDRINDARTLVIVCGSLAGGTGAGCFIDAGALVKLVGSGYASTTTMGIFVLPDVFRSVEGRIEKLRANGMAALTELNHHLSEDLNITWSQARGVENIRAPLFDHVYLFDGVNEANKDLAAPEDAYRVIGDEIFSEFFQGKLAGIKRSVRVNREQYLIGEYTKVSRLQTGDQRTILVNAERYKCQFQSFGMSRVVFPAWRLLNACSYLLAAELVTLLDNPEPIRDDIIPLRDEFAKNCGFFQGEGTWMVCRRMVRMDSGGEQATTSLTDGIYRLVNRLNDPTFRESMRTEKATQATIDKIYTQLKENFGNIFGEGYRGPWARQVETNRISFYREVQEALPKVIEDACKNPAVGPTRVSQLLGELILELNSKSAHYKSRMDQEKVGALQRMEAAELAYQDELRKTVRAETSFFVSKDAFGASVERVTQALAQRWIEACDAKVYDEASKVMADLADLLNEARARQDQLGQDMRQLTAEYQAFADFYRRRDTSPSIEELDPEQPAETFLEYYLGNTADMRQVRLRTLFDRVRERLNLSSNTALLKAMTEDKARVARQLRQQCWKALRGSDGRTVDFTQDGEPKEGFIEHHSVIRMMVQKFGAPDSPEIERLLKATFEKALPWIQPTPAASAIQGLPEKVIRDCVMAVAVGADVTERRVGETIDKATGRISASSRYTISKVSGSDPSEIIFYTELSAFIPAYLSTLREMEKSYNKLLNSPGIERALHLHRGYARFQRLMPLEPVQMNQVVYAWQVFTRAILLGVLCTRPGEDNSHFEPGFIYHEEGHDTRIPRELGIQSAAIHRLLISPDVLNRLDHQLSAPMGRVARFRPETIALSRYYRYCIFPALRTGGLAAAAERTQSRTGEESITSLAYLMLKELEDSLRAAALQEMSEAELETRVGARLRKLSDFTRLTGKTRQDLTALTPDYGDRYFEEIQGLERAEIKRIVTNMLPSDIAGAAWRGAGVFPWLTLDLDRLEKGDKAEKPTRLEAAPVADPAALSVKWRYFDGKEQLELTAAEVVPRIVANRKGSHHLWKPGMSGWARWEEVLEVASLVPPEALVPPPPPAEPPPPPSLQPPPPPAATLSSPPAPSQAPQPPPMAPAAPPVEPAPGLSPYFYSPDGASQLELPGEEVVRRIVAAPAGTHMLWKDGWPGWKSWSEVEELKARVQALTPKPAGPPPLPKAGPPPLPPKPKAPPPLQLPEEKWHYACDGDMLGELLTSEVLERLKRAPTASHQVWKEGLPGWEDATTVAPFKTALTS